MPKSEIQKPDRDRGFTPGGTGFVFSSRRQADRRDRACSSWSCLIVFVLASIAIGCWKGGGSESRPSTQPAPSADSTLRVLLAAEVPECRILAHQRINIVGTDSGTLLASDVPAGPLSFRFQDEAIVVAELGRSFGVRAVDVQPIAPDPIGLQLDDGEVRRYRGWLRLQIRSASAGDVINVVGIEDYLPAVVAAEMPVKFHEEAFRAQAIVARTFAWYQKQTAAPIRRWDVTATERSQVYPGIDRESCVPQADRAVRDTRGLVCTWDTPEGSRIFCTYYSSTCGGSTQAAGPVKNETPIGPLAGGVQCDYCRHSPDYRWGPVRLDKNVITHRLRTCYSKLTLLGVIERIEVIDKTETGRPVRLALFDANGQSEELEAENFRLAVDPTGRQIRSTFFAVTTSESDMILSNGRGFGHGIGMCQYGADGLAREGRSAAQILRFYYPGSGLTRAY